ncbi:hypothetical protein Droror1_Dr00013798 [Drosera rotundifolia]
MSWLRPALAELLTAAVWLGSGGFVPFDRGGGGGGGAQHRVLRGVGLSFGLSVWVVCGGSAAMFLGCWANVAAALVKRDDRGVLFSGEFGLLTIGWGAILVEVRTSGVVSGGVWCAAFCAHYSGRDGLWIPATGFVKTWLITTVLVRGGVLNYVWGLVSWSEVIKKGRLASGVN